MSPADFLLEPFRHDFMQRALVTSALLGLVGGLLGPLLPSLGDVETVGELLAAARKKQPQMSENERWFGLNNHSLLPQLSGSPRLSLETI